MNGLGIAEMIVVVIVAITLAALAYYRTGKRPLTSLSSFFSEEVQTPPSINRCAYEVLSLEEFRLQEQAMEPYDILSAHLESAVVEYAYGSIDNFTRRLELNHGHVNVVPLGKPGLCPDIIYVKLFRRTGSLAI